MRALLEVKQKISNLFGRFEIYLMPLIKFAVAFVYFLWIKENMGYMDRLNSMFILLILSLICSILPPGVMLLAGFALMTGHAYALCLEAGIFMLVLIVLLSIFVLRFSGGQSFVAVCTPLAFGLDVPVMLPIASGLLGNALTVFPAAGGVILYYFVRQLYSQASVLQNTELQWMEKVKIMADGLIQNWAMWLTVIAFVVVILLVNLIRTRSFSYAWRIAIISGAVTYILVMIGGSYFLEVAVSMETLAVQTLISVLLCLILEFIFFGGDYSRTERLQYEDDEYYYYVKAVPKYSVPTSERSVKRITAGQMEDRSSEDPVVSYEKKSSSRKSQTKAAPVDRPEQVDDIDFEKKLEESLKNL